MRHDAAFPRICTPGAPLASAFLTFVLPVFSQRVAIIIIIIIFIMMLLPFSSVIPYCEMLN